MTLVMGPMGYLLLLGCAWCHAFADMKEASIGKWIA